MKFEARRDETERADDSSFGDRIARHDDGIGADGGVVLQGDVAGDQVRLHLFDALGNDGDQVVGEIVAGTPDFHPGRQAAEIAGGEKPIGSAGH